MADEPSAIEAAYEAVAAALADHDKATAVRTAVEAVSSGAVSIPVLYRDVLSRILADTGEAWHRGETAIWEEHLASATVRTIVEIVYPGVLKAKAEVAPQDAPSCWPARPRKRTTSGCAWSPIASNWPAGPRTSSVPDTPVAEIADAARRLGVDAVVMSSSTHFHRLAVRHAVDALKKELPDTDVWVGRPGLRGCGDRLAARRRS